MFTTLLDSGVRKIAIKDATGASFPFTFTYKRKDNNCTRSAHADGVQQLLDVDRVHFVLGQSVSQLLLDSIS